MAIRRFARSFSLSIVAGLLSVMLSGCVGLAGPAIGMAMSAGSVAGHFALNKAITGSYTGAPSTTHASAGGRPQIQGHDAASSMDWSQAYRHKSYPGKVCAPGVGNASGVTMCIPENLAAGDRMQKSDVITQDYSCRADGKLLDCRVRS
jgi:hypothetical protein